MFDFNTAKLLLEKIPTGIFILKLISKENKEFLNVFVNETNCKIVGVDLKPFMGKTLRETFPDAYQHGFPNIYIEALEKQEEIEIGEVKYGDKTVTDQTFFLKVVPINHEYIMLTTENISSLRKVQHDLEHKNNKLTQKNKEIERITQIVSHDLKSPLHTINNLISIFKNEYGNSLESGANEYLEFIIESTERMTNLVNDILVNALIGKVNEFEKINLNSILKNVINDLQVDINTSKAHLIIPELPVVNGNYTEVRQVFQNLISNALKYNKANGVPKIEITVLENKLNWQFSIKDNGVGIPPNQLLNVFNAFTRLQNGGETSGSGIGLTNCQKIISNHGGEIWAESDGKSGSTFHFTIRKKIKKPQLDSYGFSKTN